MHVNQGSLDLIGMTGKRLTLTKINTSSNAYNYSGLMFPLTNSMIRCEKVMILYIIFLTSFVKEVGMGWGYRKANKNSRMTACK